MQSTWGWELEVERQPDCSIAAVTELVNNFVTVVELVANASGEVVVVILSGGIFEVVGSVISAML